MFDPKEFNTVSTLAQMIRTCTHDNPPFVFIVIPSVDGNEVVVKDFANMQLLSDETKAKIREELRGKRDNSLDESLASKLEKLGDEYDRSLEVKKED